MTTKFKIVVPTYNTENWIQRCLMSIRTQTYTNYECVIINDASTDQTESRIDEFIVRFGDNRFKVVHNRQNKKVLKNLIDGFNFLDAKDDPESVLVVVDGDDFLFCEFSLEQVHQHYANSNILMTYGSFIHWPTGETSFPRFFPNNIVENRDFRKHPFISSHLRTYKSKLWFAINDEDLRDTDGEYFKVGCDVATMIPMLEMSGNRFKYIQNVLYVYNRWNPLSDDVINSEDQQRIDKLIRTRKKYELL